jgi:hypothetical protein
MSLFDSISELVRNHRFLDGWSLVGRNGRPNLEIRYDSWKASGDVYFVLSRGFSFMNVRIRDGRLIEYYPSDTEDEMDLFGQDLSSCDTTDFCPYVSKTVNGDVTHLYSVAESPVSEGEPSLADRNILRWDRDGTLRTYAMVTSRRNETEGWKRTFDELTPNYAVFYYDDPLSPPRSFLVGYNDFNPSYDRILRLTEHEAERRSHRDPPQR